MNEEIKEFNEEKYVEMLENGELYDYITNLQEENEKLEKHKEYYKNETKRLGKLFYITKEENIKLEEAQKNFEKQFIKEIDYKSRIEKAVEYLEKLKNFKIKYVMLEEKELYATENDFVKELLNILRGKDK